MRSNAYCSSRAARWIGAVVAAGALWLVSGTANADGYVIGTAKLKPADRTQLVASIQAERKAHPDSFSQVRSVASKAAEMDRTKRGRFAPMGPAFKHLGPNALMPMLELIAVDAPARGNLKDSAWTALRVGLIEAVGSHRDAKARPVLMAILDGPETDYHVVRAAVEALGALGADEDANKLVALSKAGGAKQLAVLAGMGNCRRLAVAQELARVQGTHPNTDTLVAVIHALGDVGNSWAWKTPSVAAHSSEQSATRSTAARSLMDIFVANPGALREAATKALLVVDDPSTPSLIQAARKGASPELTADLDKLDKQFASNPVR